MAGAPALALAFTLPLCFGACGESDRDTDLFIDHRRPRLIVSAQPDVRDLILETATMQVDLLEDLEEAGIDTVRIRAVPEVRPGTEASILASGEIVLPGPNFLNWSSRRRTVTLRHELSHLLLRRLINHQNVPAWFREGHAEYRALRTKCDAELALRISMQVDSSFALHRFRLDALTPDGYSASHYSMFHLAYAFLVEEVTDESLLLSAIGQYGYAGGFRRAAAMSEGAFEANWRRSIRARYSTLPDSVSCLESS